MHEVVISYNYFTPSSSLNFYVLRIEVVFD